LAFLRVAVHKVNAQNSDFLVSFSKNKHKTDLKKISLYSLNSGNAGTVSQAIGIRCDEFK